MKHALRQSFVDGQALLNTFLSTPSNLDSVELMATTIAASLQKGGKPMCSGNGGSMCDAMHFAEEFSGRYRQNRRALPALSFCNPGHITCTANDFGYDEVFSRSIEAYGKAGDVYIGLSTSGNSQNIIKAVEKAKSLDIFTIGLLGKDGGKLKDMCDCELIIPGETADRIQEMHMMILHVIIEGVERLLFPEHYAS